MAININGSNYGIAVDGNLTIEHVEFGFGTGIRSASGIHREIAPDSLCNYIFDTNLFDSDEKLQNLLSEIARSIDLGERNAQYGKNEHGRINPMVKNEWYYIFEALQESGVCRKDVGDKEFVAQMMEWFPTAFSYDTPEEMKAMVDKLRKSISRERALWKYGGAKEVTKLKDMWARHNQLGIAYEKVSRFYEIAYKGLYMRLVEMKDELKA